jgi:hypothetical protein
VLIVPIWFIPQSASAQGPSEILPSRPAGSAADANGAFSELLAALRGPGPGQAVAAGAPEAPAADKAVGLARKGASGAELLFTKVQLATGLRHFEAEVKAAVLQALGRGDKAAAAAILKGAAKVVGALLAQADQAAGTNTLAVLRQRLAAQAQASTPSAAQGGAPGGAAGGAASGLAAGQDGEGAGLRRPAAAEMRKPSAHPTALKAEAKPRGAGAAKPQRGTEALQQAAAFFAWLANALRLDSPAPKLQLTASQLLLSASEAGGAAAPPAGSGPAAATASGRLQPAGPEAAGGLAEALRSLAEAKPVGPPAAAQAGGASAAGPAPAGLPAGTGRTAPAREPAQPATGGTADPAKDPGFRALVAAALAAGDHGSTEAGPTNSAPHVAVGSASTHANDFFGLLAAHGGTAPPAAAATVAASGAAGSAPAPRRETATARFSALVTGQIRSASFAGDQTRIALRPHGLGEVQIDMKRDATGHMQVVVRAENPMVLAALRNDQTTLTNILASNGFASSGSTLDFQDLGGREGSSQRQRGRAGTVGALASDEAEGAADWQQQIGPAQLDIRT